MEKKHKKTWKIFDEIADIKRSLYEEVRDEITRIGLSNFILPPLERN